MADANGMDMQRLRSYAMEITRAHRLYDIIIVSSGSVAAGKHLWNQLRATSEAADNRILAMIGSAYACTAWQTTLQQYKLTGGQLLVTHREVEDPAEGPSLRAALEANLRHQVISIVNENDALSDTELAKLAYGGDNDGLAAHIALTIKASSLLLLTDQAGLLAPSGLIRRVHATEKQWTAAKGYTTITTSQTGRGGMLSKTDAAIQAARAGIEAYIASAEQSIGDILTGKYGTHFVARR